MTNLQDPRTETNSLQTRLIWLVLVACFATGIWGVVEWRSGKNAELAEADVRHRAFTVDRGLKAADLLLVAAENFAMERGLTYKALRAKGQVGEASRDAIVSARNTADGALEKALSLMTQSRTFYRSRWSIQLVAKDRQALDRLRAKIDGRTGLVETGSQTALTREWFRTSSRLLWHSEELLEIVHVDIHRAGIDIDTDVALRLQRLTLLLTDFAGRERGAMGGAIAGNAPLDEPFSRWAIPVFQTRIKNLWTAINAIATAKEIAPDIRARIANIEAEFFGEVETIRVAIRNASKARAPYPITADEWFMKASSAIESVVVLGRDLGKLAQARTGTMVRQAG